MYDRLTDTHLDLLQQHLIVPQAISDLLRHNLPIEPDMQYGLHMALSEIDPDSALLAIALCATEIADKYLADIPIASGLKKEAETIIQDYGSQWLHYHKHGPMPQSVFKEILEAIPEDLEAMADILDVLAAELEEHDSGAIILLNLLSIQARAHMEIAEYMLLEIQMEEVDIDESNHANGSFIYQPPQEEKTRYENNVVLFPIERARQN